MNELTNNICIKYRIIYMKNINNSHQRPANDNIYLFNSLGKQKQRSVAAAKKKCASIIFE